MAKVTLDLGKLNALADAKAERGIQVAALRGEAILRGTILSQPGTGRMYSGHRASAPGEPPAADTGSLRSRTQADTQVRKDGASLVGRVVANTNYAAYLETGTKHSARSRTADALRGLNTTFNPEKPVFGPAQITALASEVGTEKMAPRPFLSKLLTEYAGELREAFILAAKGLRR